MTEEDFPSFPLDSRTRDIMDLIDKMANEYQKQNQQRESTIRFPETDEERKIMELKLRLFYMKTENQRIANSVKSLRESAKNSDPPVAYVMNENSEFPKITVFKNAIICIGQEYDDLPICEEEVNDRMRKHRRREPPVLAYKNHRRSSAANRKVIGKKIKYT